jgi:long-chain acyl-CoA synthetase
MIERLFDIVNIRYDAAPDETLLAAKEAGTWREYPVREVWETACSMSNALLELGIENAVLEPESQEKIAVISPNRPEWIMTDVAVQLTGAVLTPIYPTIAPDELSFVLNDASVRKVFIASADLYNRYKPVLDAMPWPMTVYTFDDVPGVPNWKTLRHEKIKPDQGVTGRITGSTLATIIYTSGTTGAPKGVMLSHDNVVHNVKDSMPAFTFAKNGERALSFLPLNHIFERMVTNIYINGGLSIWYAESMETIGDNLREVKPMVFCTVPRLLEKVYERIMNKASELTGIKKQLFFWALNLGKRYDNVDKGGIWYQIQLAIANRLVFSKWREALGGKVKAIVTGSAAAQERLIRIFSAAGIIIMEGYGLTETSPVISVNLFESEGRRIGTIGPVIQNVEVKLAEDGEILTKGRNVMMGYYKRPEMTAEVMQDGWFHTGDIGQWIEGRFLKITDRKKEMFKTSGGKYVAPQALENAMRQSPFIEQIIVIGNSRKFVSALIIPAFANVRKALLEKQQITAPSSNDAMIKMDEVHKLIRAELDKYNKHFSNYEQIKKFELLAHEWTINSGELTPKLSMRRKVIEQKFNAQIEGMYDQAQI